MSFYCKKCATQSMSEPFEDNLCDQCWDKLYKWLNRRIYNMSTEQINHKSIRDTVERLRALAAEAESRLTVANFPSNE